MGMPKDNDNLMHVEESVLVEAPKEAVYHAVLACLRAFPGEHEGDVLHFTLEEWPGGRWFRDLGPGQGHLWGFVQAIKPPSLIEIHGPMFMSYAVAGNLIVRLTPADNGTTLSLRHQVFGVFPEDYRAGMAEGWAHWVQTVASEAVGA
jgi:hypothetical protein